MRSLAEFIMAGRLKAALVALLGNFLPLVSPAAVGLVVLRRGLTEGCLVLLWAVVPLLILLNTENMNGAMVWASIFSVLVVLVGASALTQTQAWTSALKVMLGVSVVSGLAMKLLLATEVGAMREALTEMLRQLQQQNSALVFEPSDLFVAGLIAWVIALTAVAALLLARWWQSLLYNPGGFGVEFHALRFDRLSASLLFGALMGCYLLGQEYVTWGNLLGLPLLLGGVALVHHTIAFAQLSTRWLVVFYMGLVFLLGPLSSVLIGLGFLDSVMDFRSRLAARRSS
ncbi:MAG: hypothetical protein KBT88_08720 [Gammaproteobacteria bacterium]|nr:hypothetical protein [Gammaproteobacteria bacterium]MBQ0839857.1 hypothetical protein [Gammaproteobacteria bacterium]